MTQQLGALAAFADNPGSIPSTHTWLTTVHNPSYPLLTSESPRHTYDTHSYIERNIVDIKLINVKKIKLH